MNRVERKGRLCVERYSVDGSYESLLVVCTLGIELRGLTMLHKAVVNTEGYNLGGLASTCEVGYNGLANATTDNAILDGYDVLKAATNVV